LLHRRGASDLAILIERVVRAGSGVDAIERFPSGRIEYDAAQVSAFDRPDRNHARIFTLAEDLEQLRAMQQTGEQFREGKINIHSASLPANNQNIANGGTHAE